jgi:hypothetical protein
LPPTRRNLLSTKPQTAEDQVFYTAAIQAKGWIDPNGAASAKIFTNLINSVTSGQARSSDAVSDADTQLQALMSSTQ